MPFKTANIVTLLIIISTLIMSCVPQSIKKQQVNSLQSEQNRQDQLHVKQEDLNSNSADSVDKKSESYKLLQRNNRNNNQMTKRIKVKGIYVSATTAGGHRLKKLIHLADATDINAMVIDIKDDNGRLTYDSNIQLANEIGADQKPQISDIHKLLELLKSHHIYSIGRVVTFKDPLLALRRPETALQRKQGGIWRDGKGSAWVDPFHPLARQYNIDIAKEAAKKGFDEIQFDYVRFPDNGTKVDREVKFYRTDQSKPELIKQFLRDASNQLHPIGKFVSADVFGFSTSSSDDLDIGHQWGQITQVVDYICPMVYPSHYANGIYGITNPDLHPFEVVKNVLDDAINKNRTVKTYASHTAAIRPWLQDFTAAWLKNHQIYGTQQIKEQIRALQSLGIEEYLLWNPGNRYNIPSR